MEMTCKEVVVGSFKVQSWHLLGEEVTGYELGCRGIGVRFPAGEKIFLFSTTSGSPLLPLRFLTSEYRGRFFLVEKRPERESDYLHIEPRVRSYTRTPFILYSGV
jgi:hypothetical protein